MQAIGKQKEISSLFLFVLVSYAQIWLLYGIGKLLGISFSMDPRQLGGLFYLFGAAAPLFATMVATVISSGREGLNHLFRRSFGHFGICHYFLCRGLSNGVAAAIATVFLPRPLFKLQWKSHS